VGVDDVGEVDPAVQELVDLEVDVGEGGAGVVAVVRFGEEAGGAQDDDGEVEVPGGELAEVLGGDLGGAVDVANLRRRVLGDPHGGLPGLGCQRSAEGAGAAGEHQAARTGLRRRLQHGEGARDVGLDEVLPGVRADVRLVQGRGVQHVVDAGEGAADRVAVGDRARDGGEGQGQDVEPTAR
jgi:hypothetical protein